MAKRSECERLSEEDRVEKFIDQDGKVRAAGRRLRSIGSRFESFARAWDESNDR
jgi:hypothetical protein